MRFIHLSDLHIGKRVNEFSMLDDQRYILLDRIVDCILAEKPDAVLIAGDVYDKTVPSAEAVQLLDDFLVKISGLVDKVFVISGNHDSPERIAFGSKIMDIGGVHMSPVYDGFVKPVSMEDGFGRVDVFMLPFIKPAHVRACIPEADPANYSDAVKAAIGRMDIDGSNRNVLVTHQFVTGATRCDSEDISVGGSDNVDADVFGQFDYVALGHLHRPQHVGRKSVRYCGTPLKYSFSEAGDRKSVTVVDLLEKENVVVREVLLAPLRDMREIKGSYMRITDRGYYKDLNTGDYFHITLTDEEDVLDAIGKLRAIYPNIMRLDYDNERTRSNAEVRAADDLDKKTPLELFAEFYEAQNNKELSKEQRGFVSGLIERIWEGGK